MTHNTKTFFSGMLVGVTMLFIALSIHQTVKYGRMSNHLYCDHSVTALNSSRESGSIYYSHGHRADTSYHPVRRIEENLQK